MIYLLLCQSSCNCIIYRLSVRWGPKTIRVASNLIWKSNRTSFVLKLRCDQSTNRQIIRTYRLIQKLLLHSSESECELIFSLSKWRKLIAKFLNSFFSRLFEMFIMQSNCLLFIFWLNIMITVNHRWFNRRQLARTFQTLRRIFNYIRLKNNRTKSNDWNQYSEESSNGFSYLFASSEMSLSSVTTK